MRDKFSEMKNRYREYRNRKHGHFHHQQEKNENDVNAHEKEKYKKTKDMPNFKYVKAHHDLHGVAIHNKKREHDEQYKAGLMALSDLI